MDISATYNEFYYNYKAQLAMLLDKNRTLKYKYAIFKAIQPGDVVIDFGCGTGILGFFALQAGASRIYAIEETSIIDYAYQLAIKNGYEDRIKFINKLGKEINEQDIPEQVDIIISEPFSNLLLEGDLWSSIEYLKKFLKPTGIILPESGTLYIAPVRSPPRVFQEAQFIEGKNVYNIDFGDLPRIVFYSSSLASDAWLTEPQQLLHLQLLEDRLQDSFSNSVKCNITNAGKLYGVELFFKANLFNDTSLSSKEQGLYSAWQPLFAPSSIQPSLLPKDSLEITVKNIVVNSFRQLWYFTYKHHSQLLPLNAGWWKSKSAVPKLTPRVAMNQSQLERFENDNYVHYKGNSELENDFINLFPYSLSCSEICQSIYQSQKFDLNYDSIWETLIEMIHKLMRLSLISLAIPKDRMLLTQFESQINIP